MLALHYTAGYNCFSQYSRVLLLLVCHVISLCKQGVFYVFTFVYTNVNVK